MVNPAATTKHSAIQGPFQGMPVNEASEKKKYPADTKPKKSRTAAHPYHKNDNRPILNSREQAASSPATPFF